MDVFLDTNILRADLGLDSGPFTILLDDAAKTELENNLLSIDEFYVYEMRDGSHRCEIVYIGEVEMSFHVEAREDDHAYGWDPYRSQFGYAFERAGGPEICIEPRSAGAEVRVVVDAVIKDRAVKSWRITDIEPL